MAVINLGPSGPFGGHEKLLTNSMWAPEGTVTSDDRGRRRLFYLHLSPLSTEEKG